MRYLPSVRMTFLLVAIACTLMMLIALLYFQMALDLAPCPLCITQRIFVILVGLISLAAFFHHPRVVWRRVYAGLATLMALIGAGVSTRHVWLQHLPEDQVPACGPGLSYMFETFPLADALRLLFQGDGNCAELSWSLLGLSIPAWTLVGFIGLAAVGLFQLFRKG